MKAIQFTDYGTSEVIKLNDVEKPQPTDKEILIKIAATTVNPMEIKVRSGFFKGRYLLISPTHPVQMLPER